MDLSGASALVTGGASGLGLATAKRLADAGAHVVIVDLPSSPGADRAAELGGTFAPADVTDPAQVAAAVATAGEHGPLRQRAREREDALRQSDGCRAELDRGLARVYAPIRVHEPLEQCYALLHGPLQVVGGDVLIAEYPEGTQVTLDAGDSVGDG